MDNLDRLSDAELRHRLLQYGFPNMPVTATTRSLLIKRLRNHVKNEKAKLSRETSYVTRYSSGDESDVDVKSKRGRSTGLLCSKNKLGRSPLSKIYVPSPVRSKDYNTYVAPLQAQAHANDYVYPSLASKLPSNQEDSFRDNLSDDSVNSHHSPTYTSDYSRRLLNLRNQTIRNSIVSKREPSMPAFTPKQVQDILERSKNGPPAKKFQLSLTNYRNLFSEWSEQYGSSIPCILLSALVLFLAIVSFFYMNMTPDRVNAINKSNAIYNVCDTQTNYDFDTSGKYCVDEDSIQFAVTILKHITPELERRAKQYYCVDKTNPFFMSEQDIIKYMSSQDSMVGVNKIHNSLPAVEYLIDQNPQWKLANVESSGRAISMKDVYDLRDTRGNAVAILNPSLPWSCFLYIKIQTLFTIVGLLTLAYVIIFVVLKVYMLVKSYRQSKADTLNMYISEIMNELQSRALNDSENSCIVINHLRDKIIPLKGRRNKEAIWNKAIEYLEQHESRIQFDMIVRNGENCKTIKWIDPVLPEGPMGSSLKKWHSPAFDKSNKITNPPTECLKIRQMFDKFETNNPNLKELTQDAILEKVGPSCKIYDIQLDTESCCVYVRCASSQDAGIVHNEINGWWFDKRLVSIKFLRLERYLSRFPLSNSGPDCLQPSNSKNLSMSHCDRGPNSLNGVDVDDEEDLF